MMGGYSDEEKKDKKKKRTSFKEFRSEWSRIKENVREDMEEIKESIRSDEYKEEEEEEQVEVREAPPEPTVHTPVKRMEPEEKIREPIIERDVEPVKEVREAERKIEVQEKETGRDERFARIEKEDGSAASRYDAKEEPMTKKRFIDADKREPELKRPPEQVMPYPTEPAKPDPLSDIDLGIPLDEHIVMLPLKLEIKKFEGDTISVHDVERTRKIISKTDGQTISQGNGGDSYGIRWYPDKVHIEQHIQPVSVEEYEAYRRFIQEVGTDASGIHKFVSEMKERIKTQTDMDAYKDQWENFQLAWKEFSDACGGPVRARYILEKDPAQGQAEELDPDEDLAEQMMREFVFDTLPGKLYLLTVNNRLDRDSTLEAVDELNIDGLVQELIVDLKGSDQGSRGSGTGGTGVGTLSTSAGNSLKKLVSALPEKASMSDITKVAKKTGSMVKNDLEMNDIHGVSQESVSMIQTYIYDSILKVPEYEIELLEGGIEIDKTKATFDLGSIMQQDGQGNTHLNSDHWMFSYQEAKNIGMAVEIGDPEKVKQIQEADWLVAVGTDRTSGNPMEAIFESNKANGELSLIPQDTPTTNTEYEKTPFVRNENDPVEYLKRTLKVSDSVYQGCDGCKIEDLMGLSRYLLNGLEGSSLREQEQIGKMSRLTWELCTYLPNIYWKEFNESYASISSLYPKIGDFFVDHVHARGNLPTLRIGSNPYGILPVISSRDYTPYQETGLFGTLSGFLYWMKDYYLGLAEDVPVLEQEYGETDDLDKLKTILGHGRISRSLWSRGFSHWDEMGIDYLKDEDPYEVDRSIRVQGLKMFRKALSISDLESPALQAVTLDQTIASKTSYLNTLFKRISQISLFKSYYNYVRVLKNIVGRESMASIDSAINDILKLKLDQSTTQTLFMESLDTLSYRLDSWLTGIADERLDQCREKVGSMSGGPPIGAYGFLEAPGVLAKGEKAGEYLPAPSPPHATVAALFRNSALNSVNEDDSEAFQVNLNSERVRRAIWFFNGIRNGYLPEELLGYILERGIHDNQILHDGLIYHLRERYPLDIQKPEGSVENPKSYTVVDGKKFLDALSIIEDLLLTGSKKVGDLSASQKVDMMRRIVGSEPGKGDMDEFIDFIEKNSYIRMDDKKNIDNEGNKFLENFAKIYDKVNQLEDAAGDLAVFETVFEYTNGNIERCGAWISFMNGEGYPPEPLGIRSRRSGRIRNKKVFLLVETDKVQNDKALREYLSKVINKKYGSGGEEDPDTISEDLLPDYEGMSIISDSIIFDENAIGLLPVEHGDEGEDSFNAPYFLNEISDGAPNGIFEHKEGGLVNMPYENGFLSGLEDYSYVREEIKNLMELKSTHPDLSAWIDEYHASGQSTENTADHIYVSFTKTVPYKDLICIEVDEWSEFYPDATEMTGLAMHFESPKSEPPQAILLAAPPVYDPERNWNMRHIANTLLETIELMNIRMVNSDKVYSNRVLGQYLPVPFLIHPSGQKVFPEKLKLQLEKAVQVKTPTIGPVMQMAFSFDDTEGGGG